MKRNENEEKGTDHKHGCPGAAARAGIPRDLYASLPELRVQNERGASDKVAPKTAAAAHQVNRFLIFLLIQLYLLMRLC
jgi:hypothetical protein